MVYLAVAVYRVFMKTENGDKQYKPNAYSKKTYIKQELS